MFIIELESRLLYYDRIYYLFNTIKTTRYDNHVFTYKISEINYSSSEVTYYSVSVQSEDDKSGVMGVGNSKA